MLDPVKQTRENDISDYCLFKDWMKLVCNSDSYRIDKFDALG